MILLTPPETIKHEHELIGIFFSEGLARLHVRKPAIDRESMKHWLEGIDAAFRDRLVLHQHYDLAGDYGITGLHHPEHIRAQIGVQYWSTDFVYSTSVHDIVTFNQLPEIYQYAFIGTVFESISKPGYIAGGSILEQLSYRSNRHTALIALGGISTKTLECLTDKGFDGFAFLGGIWQQDDPLKAFRQIMQLIK